MRIQGEMGLEGCMGSVRAKVNQPSLTVPS